MQEKWVRRLDRWHINDKEEMEVSDELEKSFMYMINMRRSIISEGYQMQRADFKDRGLFGIRGVWRRYKERKAAEKQAREDAKPKYVDFDDLMGQVTTKAAEKGELHAAEGTDSTLSEFPSADDTPEEEYALMISEERARQEREAAIAAGLIDEEAEAEAAAAAAAAEAAEAEEGEGGEGETKGAGGEGGGAGGGRGCHEAHRVHAEEVRVCVGGGGY